MTWDVSMIYLFCLKKQVSNPMQSWHDCEMNFFLILNNYYCSKTLVTLKLISLLIWAHFFPSYWQIYALSRYALVRFTCKLFKGIKAQRKNSRLESEKSGFESQLCYLMAGGVKLCNHLTWEGWILRRVWKPLQEMVWPGLVEKSCQHGTVLQMAAVSPIVLTWGELIFTREDTIDCSEKIAGRQ